MTKKTDAAPDKGYEQRTIAIDALEPNKWNPQKEDDATFNRLREEIRTVGFIDPIEVVPLDDGKYQILGGEHRWRAALAEGLTEVPVMVLTGAKWKEEDLRKFVTLRLNTLRGKLDPEKFARLYNEMADKYGANALQDLFGFTDGKGFQKLLAGISKGLAAGLGKDLQKKFDQNAKEAKTVEELTSILQELFAKYGDSLDQNFMVFTHGRKEHIYIAMGPKLKMSMEKLMEYCRLTKTDINEVFVPVAEDLVKRVESLMAKDFE